MRCAVAGGRGSERLEKVRHPRAVWISGNGRARAGTRSRQLGAAARMAYRDLPGATRGCVSITHSVVSHPQIPLSPNSAGGTISPVEWCRDSESYGDAFVRSI